MAEVAQAKETKLSVPAPVAEPSGLLDSISRIFSDPEQENRQSFVKKMLENPTSEEYKAVESFLKSKDPLSEVQGLKTLLNISGTTNGQYLDPNNQTIDAETKAALIKFCKEVVIPHKDISKGSILTNDTALGSVTDYDVQNLLASKLKSEEANLGESHPTPENRLWKNIQQGKEGATPISTKVDLGEQNLDERNPISKGCEKLGSMVIPEATKGKSS